MDKDKLINLQRLIDKAVKTANAAYKASDALMNECMVIYGVIPGDVDCDEILDHVLGAIGMCSSMSAENFDKSMRECMIRNGIDPDEENK